MPFSSANLDHLSRRGQQLNHLLVLNHCIFLQYHQAVGSTMVMSKSQCDAAMKHILQQVLDEDEDSPLCQALIFHDIASPQFMCSLDDSEFHLLTYPDEAGNLNTPPLGSMVCLPAFKAFIAHQATIGKEIKAGDWTDISPGDFNRYRTSHAFFTYQKSMPSQGAKLSSIKCATQSAKLETTSGQVTGSSLTITAVDNCCSAPAQETCTCLTVSVPGAPILEPSQSPKSAPVVQLATPDAPCPLLSAFPAPTVPPILMEIGIQPSMVPPGLSIPVLTLVPQVPPMPPETCTQPPLVLPLAVFSGTYSAPLPVLSDSSGAPLSSKSVHHIYG